jgi:hypothetical protein
MSDPPLSGIAACGMNENKVARDQAPENQVKANRCRVQVGKKSPESDGGEKNSSEKASAMAMMEVMAGFESLVSIRVDIEQACIHQTIARIKHPNS